MLRYILPLLALAFASAASAQTVSPPGVPIGGGIACAYNSSTPTLTAGTAGWVQCDSSGKLIVIPGTAAPGTFVGLVGGFNAIINNTPTIANSSHVYTSATNTVALGGLQTVAAFRNTTQPSGILNYVSLTSASGSTAGITIWGFNRNPSASTCTDNNQFVLNSADWPYVLPGFPITLTPAAAIGQATPSVAAQSVVESVKNADSSPTVNLYFCAVVNSTFTPNANGFTFSYALVQD